MDADGRGISAWAPFAELAAHPRLLADAAAGPLDAEAVMRLRRRYPAELVAQAVDLLKARRKAEAKFGEHAAAMLVDVTGVEQASSLHVARHKAKRFAAAGVQHVADLCCGIGGDAAALAEVAQVLAVDHDFNKAWMARHNVAAITDRRCDAAAADVTRLNLRGVEAFHIDPDRRRDGRRVHDYEDMEPGPEFLERLIEECDAGAIKLGPGVELDDLPSGEIELIQRGSTLVQAVLWTGRLAQLGDDERRATKLPAGGTRAEPASFAGGADVPLPVGEARRYLLAVEPAIERAGLMAALCEELGVAAIHPALGLLTADEEVRSEWLTPFELLEVLPWRPGKVKAWLRANDGGIVEVKTRGGAVNPDVVQRQLRGSGSTPYTLHILRMERKVVCFITRRV